MDEVTFSNVAPVLEVLEVRDLDRALRRYRKLGFFARAYDGPERYAAWSTSGVVGRFIPPHDTPYGLREFAFVDRDGTAHRVGAPLPTG